MEIKFTNKFKALYKSSFIMETASQKEERLRSEADRAASIAAEEQARSRSLRNYVGVRVIEYDYETPNQEYIMPLSARWISDAEAVEAVDYDPMIEHYQSLRRQEAEAQEQAREQQQARLQRDNNDRRYGLFNPYDSLFRQMRHSWEVPTRTEIWEVIPYPAGGPEYSILRIMISMKHETPTFREALGRTKFEFPDWSHMEPFLLAEGWIREVDPYGERNFFETDD